MSSQITIVKSNDRPILVVIDPDTGYVYDGEGGCLFTAEKLTTVLQAIDATLIAYRDEAVTDDVVREHNAETARQRLEKETKEMHELMRATKVAIRGFVYLVSDKQSGRHKIGFSKNPKRRLVNLQASNPAPLELLAQRHGTMSDERELHLRYGHRHLHGEWFSLSPTEINEIVIEFKEASHAN